MPCRDYDRDDYEHKDLYRRNDELAAELCKVRGLLASLVSVFKIIPKDTRLTSDVLVGIEEQMVKHRQHRALDKEHAVSKIESQQKMLAGKASKIRELGGFPGPELLQELDSVTSMLKEYKNSDPLTTELY